MSARVLPVVSIAAVGVLCWIWFVQIGRGMSMQTSMPGMRMGIGALAAMWAVMMAAMMAPAAAPSYLLHVRMSSKSRLASTAYLAGYIGMWCAVGVVYALLHWAFQQAGLMDRGMRVGSTPLAGGLLIAAGLWQLSPAKASCVARCRSPLGFMLNDWRDGTGGSFKMGLHYAAWCVGCCWLVMGVLFVVGAMSFAWAALISLYVLAERLFPLDRAFDRAMGIGLIAWGDWLIAPSLVAWTI